jgi:hypothetical protein
VSESAAYWRELHNLINTLQIDYQVLEGEHNRLMTEVDALKTELNYLRTENIVLRSNA